GEPPPNYAPMNELASSFRLETPLIYATKPSNAPRYQLMQEFTRSGKPRKLSIRRLLQTEWRSYSLPSDSLLAASTSRGIEYDKEGTMYTIIASTLYAVTTYEMRGHRSSTLGRNIQVETGGSVLGGKWTKI
ncbi:hypothetical protein K469DRAFT_552655, partial [Zopfia rhizophila CBS 207.26]